MMLKLFVDDVRFPPSHWEDHDEWMIVRSYVEARALIELHGLAKISQISLDHDLGEEKTGYDLLCDIEARVHGGDALPEIWVHSRNPVGAIKMVAVINALRAWYEAKSK